MHSILMGQIVQLERLGGRDFFLLWNMGKVPRLDAPWKGVERVGVPLDEVCHHRLPLGGLDVGVEPLVLEYDEPPPPVEGEDLEGQEPVGPVVVGPPDVYVVVDGGVVVYPDPEVGVEVEDPDDVRPRGPELASADHSADLLVTGQPAWPDAW